MEPVADLVPLFQREFELCALREGELVALLTEPRTRPEYVGAAGGAALALGAEVFDISVRGQGWQSTPFAGRDGMSVAALTYPGRMLDAIRDALSQADFVVDLITNTILHRPLRDELKKANCRILTVVEPPDALERMFPTPEITAEVIALRDRLAAASTLHVGSAAGTDLTFDLSVTIANGQKGFVDEAGTWDHWPSALVTGYPDDDTARGTWVLAPGDVVLPFNRYVETPVTMHVEEGFIQAVEGGLDADYVRYYLDSFEDREVYRTSHVGFGVHTAAQWNALSFYDKRETMGMDARCFRGSFLVSTGPNRFTGRYVDAHLDIPMRECTVSLDEDVVLEAGTLVGVDALVS